MSRIGKQPVPIPENVRVTIKGRSLTINGPKGELSWDFHPDMSVTQKDKQIVVTRPNDTKIHKSLHGLTRMLIANMVEGVTKGYQKTLEISGIGYTAEIKGRSLLLNVGFSHPVLFTPPEDITLNVPSNLVVTVTGIDKQKVGEIAAKLRSISPPEPYKGKGIRYKGEYVRRKAGKKVGVK